MKRGRSVAERLVGQAADDGVANAPDFPLRLNSVNMPVAPQLNCGATGIFGVRTSLGTISS
jgi:hypothetical protein